MSALDDVHNQGNSKVISPDAREKIRRIAYEHSMTLAEARIHFLRQQDE